MQLRTCLLSACMGAALALGTAALAADLPKEGTFTATYAGAGTCKITSFGKERLLGAFDENGLTVGSGRGTFPRLGVLHPNSAAPVVAAEIYQARFCRRSGSPDWSQAHRNRLGGQNVGCLGLPRKT